MTMPPVFLPRVVVFFSVVFTVGAFSGVAGWEVAHHAGWRQSIGNFLAPDSEPVPPEMPPVWQEAFEASLEIAWDPYSNRSLEDWQQEHITTLQGLFPASFNRPEFGLQERLEGHQVIQELWIDTRVVGYPPIAFMHLLPQDSQPLRGTILVVPGSGHGLADVVIEGLGYQDGIGQLLAREGWEVFVVENLGWGSRTIDPGLPGYPAANYAGVKGILFDDFLAQHYVADALEVLNWIQNNRTSSSDSPVGVMGISLGGAIASTVSALAEDGVDFTVVSSGALSVPAVQGASQFILPGYLTQTNALATLQMVAPSPLLLTYGENDQSFPFRQELQVGRLIGVVKDTYAAVAAGDLVTVILHSGGHEYPVPELLDFLTEQATQEESA